MLFITPSPIHRTLFVGPPPTASLSTMSRVYVALAALSLRHASFHTLSMQLVSVFFITMLFYLQRFTCAVLKINGSFLFTRSYISSVID